MNFVFSDKQFNADGVLQKRVPSGTVTSFKLDIISKN